MSTYLSAQAITDHDTDTSPRPIGLSAIRRGDIERAADLGGGYLLVKIASPGLPVASNETPLPIVPRNQVRSLLAKFSGDTPAKMRITRTEPEDNTALLNNLESAALARRQRLHENGELLTSAQICARLGISRQALSKAVRDRRMFWLDGASGAQWYPGFFADDAISRRDLERVSVALGELPGAVKWQFFTTPKHSLDGKTPVEAIREGKSDAVVRTAVETLERSLGR
jgi:hypothetical protein